ncbi:CHAT domain-containing protein [Mycena epipterygia]|nr:CHAT domain-containing protein [Mycena epipterygia]
MSTQTGSIIDNVSEPISNDNESDMSIIEQTPLGHPDLPKYKQWLGEALQRQYEEMGDLDDLQVALQTKKEAVDLTPEGHPDRADRLQSLAESFTDQYQRLRELDDIEAALQLNQEAVDLTPEGHPDRAGRLQSLAVSFTDRYRRQGELNDLGAALRLAQEAVDLTPGGHPDRAAHLTSLALTFKDQYQRLGDLDDLQAALRLDQEAVDLTPEEHPDRAYRLQCLAVSFSDQYHRLGDLNDLQAALQLDQEAVDLTPEGHPDRAGRLTGLALSLKDQYQRLGDLADLEASLWINQEAVGLMPKDHPDRRLGDLDDLEAALRLAQETVNLTPDGHPERAGRLQNLAVSFTDRYWKLGDLNYLEAALRLDEETVDLSPKGHPDRPGCLQHLAVSFRDRYKRLGDLNDLGAAINKFQEAVDLNPKDHPDKPDYLQSLALSLTDRYQRLGNLDDLEAALQHQQEALDLTPKSHPDRARHLQSLALSFKYQYRSLGDLDDLEAASLSLDQEAVNLTPDNHPNRAGRLQSLAVSYTDRYRRLRDIDDLESAYTHYTASFKIPSSTPERSWNEALNWASFAQEVQSSKCITAYLNAFNLLPEILWIGNLLSVRHEAIHCLNIEQVTSAAVKTCIDFSDLVSAVEIMEQGLGITFQQMLQLRTDLHQLPPDQAKKLQFLSSELYSGTPHHPRDVAMKRQNLLKEICQQPALQYFLLSKPYKELCHASRGGPVVILNSHPDHCDGILILHPTSDSDPVHVPFPNVTLDMLKSQQEALQGLFVFQHGIHNGRLWWLPTGAFTGLPLHASPPADQFIHSYTATLGSLLDGYSKKSSTAPKVGVVGVTDTGGGSNYLPGVEQEVKNILSIIPKEQIECLEGKQATVDAVKLQLHNCSWMHLACHGTQDVVDPTKSCLLLCGGNLEMETILRMPLKNAEFVFLAACQTAMGDAKLDNESFHLGGGFIAAGFRGAIGTMWSMNDSDGPVVAEVVYSHLFREGRQPQANDAAEALHLAVKELKERKVSYERWIPFIHMGI